MWTAGVDKSGGPSSLSNRCDGCSHIGRVVLAELQAGAAAGEDDARVAGVGGQQPPLAVPLRDASRSEFSMEGCCHRTCTASAFALQPLTQNDCSVTSCNCIATPSTKCRAPLVATSVTDAVRSSPQSRGPVHMLRRTSIRQRPAPRKTQRSRPVYVREP
jgi:hypothetical protein